MKIRIKKNKHKLNQAKINKIYLFRGKNETKINKYKQKIKIKFVQFS